ncbi:hypothetical protein E4T56_gene7176 [Termitomyces sp. T112]|nr:hypothetical protein E4T56_gene7176 [Termitomyces sp. T112]
MKFSLLFVTALLSVASAIPTGLDDSNGLEARQRGRCGNRNRAVPFYRLYNGQVIDHFYTTNNNEANNAVAVSGYTREGISSYIFQNQQPGTVPFFRLYSASATDHFYTTSASEASNAQNLGYTSEGVAGASGTDHFYTTSASERASAIRGGYSDEGVAGYVYMA